MVNVTRILMDYETAPIGLDHVPQLSWEIASEQRDVLQTAYQVQLATEAAFVAPLYDTGWIEQSTSAHVVLPLPLQSLQRYYVRVRVRADGAESAFSEAAQFVTALLKDDAWQAPFITAETDASYYEKSRGTLLRGEFTIEKPLRAAYACTTALGLYHFYLNGTKVGEDEMAPGWTSYQKHLLYQVYDVLPMLAEGVNVAGAMLGAGWYKGVMGLTKACNNYGDKTAFAMQLVLEFIDGSKKVVTTDNNWVGYDSPVVFSEIYDGETYDARKEIANWAKAIPAPAGSHSVQTVAFDTSVLRAQAGARIRTMHRIPAVALLQTPAGEQVVDFGQNMAGHVEITAQGNPGDSIVLRCFETLDAAGNVYVENLREAKTTLQYTFGQEEHIIWRPRFTYMGFRYVQILRWPGAAKAANFTACTVHSHMEPKGSLTTSNPLLNQLLHNILWGLKSNFLDVPTDCPQRDERLGWTGDAQIFCRTAMYLVNGYSFFRKWLVDVAADQTAEGGVAHVVPNIELGRTDDNWLLSQGPDSAAAWADVAVILPWNLYLMYGDTEILHRQYDSMKAWIDFMQNHAEQDIWNYKLQFGDWVALDAEPGSYFGATPNDLTCTAYYAYSTSLFAKTARVLGKEAVAQEYEALAQRIVKRFQECFFTPQGDMTAQTQTAHILALHFDLVPPQFREKTIAALNHLLDKENGHLVTGFVGTPYFCHALSRNGCVAQAYRLLLQEDYPSWLYQVKMGATTVWEHWDGLKPDGSMWSADMNSFNHYAYGAVGEWMFRVMAGLDTDEAGPGFAHSVIYPRMGGALSFVEGSYHSVYGKVACRWELEGARAAVTVQVPPNTTATLRLEQVQEILQADGVSFVSLGQDAQAQIGSGTYHIIYQRLPA